MIEVKKDVDNLKGLCEGVGHGVPLTVENEICAGKLRIGVTCERMVSGSLDLNVSVSLELVTCKVLEGVSIVGLYSTLNLVIEGDLSSLLGAVNVESELSELLSLVACPSVGSGNVECLNKSEILSCKNVLRSTALLVNLGALITLLELRIYDSLKRIGGYVLCCDLRVAEGSLELKVSYKKLALEVIEVKKNVNDFNGLAEINIHSVPLAVKDEVCAGKLRIIVACKLVLSSGLDLNVSISKELIALEIGELISLVLLNSTLDLIIEGKTGSEEALLLAIYCESELGEVLLGRLIPRCSSGNVECFNSLAVLLCENVYGSTAIGIDSCALIALLELAVYNGLKSCGSNLISCNFLVVELLGSYVTEYEIVELEAGILNGGSTININGSNSAGGDRHCGGYSVNLNAIEVVSESHGVVIMKLNLNCNVKPRSELILADLNGLDNVVAISKNVNSLLRIGLNGSDVKSCEGGLAPIPSGSTTVCIKLELNVLKVVVATYLEGKEANCVVSAGEVEHKLGVTHKRYPDLLLRSLTKLKSIGRGLMRIKHLILTSLVDLKSILTVIVINYLKVIGVGTVSVVTGELIGCATAVSAGVNESIDFGNPVGSTKIMAKSLNCGLTAARAYAILGAGCLSIVAKSGSVNVTTGTSLRLGTSSSKLLVCLIVELEVTVLSATHNDIIDHDTGVSCIGPTVDIENSDIKRVNGHCSGERAVVYAVDVVVSGDGLIILKGDEDLNVEPLRPAVLNCDGGKLSACANAALKNYTVLGVAAYVKKLNLCSTPTSPVGLGISTVRKTSFLSAGNVERVGNVGLHSEGDNACRVSHAVEGSKTLACTVGRNPEHVLCAGSIVVSPTLVGAVRLAVLLLVVRSVRNLGLLGSEHSNVLAIFVYVNGECAVSLEYKVVLSCAVHVLVLVENVGLAAVSAGDGKLILYKRVRKIVTKRIAYSLTATVTYASLKAGCLSSVVTKSGAVNETARASLRLGTSSSESVVCLAGKHVVSACGITEYHVVEHNAGVSSIGPAGELECLDLHRIKESAICICLGKVSRVRAAEYAVDVVIGVHVAGIEHLDCDGYVEPLGPAVLNSDSSKIYAGVNATSN